MMQKLTQFVPKGVNGMEPSEFEGKEEVLSRIKQLFKKKGFHQVQTPIFEYYDLFNEIKGTIDKDQMIKLIDTDGKILVLRPDATIPIARMVAETKETKDGKAVQKYSYVTSIFRMNNDPQNIQSREFTQAGIEWFGSDGVQADAEIITLAILSLIEAGVDAFTVDIGKANFYKKLIEQIELAEHEIQFIQRLIENKNFLELESYVQELMIPAPYKEALAAIPTLYGEPEKVFARANQIAVNDEMKMEIEHLEEVVRELEAAGFGNFLTVDLGLINHLNYYSGIVFHGYIAGYGQPVLLGGRYDGLTKQFGYDTKAIGFAIYADHLITALKAQEGGTRSWNI